jgi:diguanylate cyclase (GGDEF)-like protein
MTPARSVRLLSSGLGLAAAALLASWARPAHLEGPVTWWAVVLLAAAFFVAEAYPLHVDTQGQTFTMSLSELPLVIGLMCLPPEAVVIARVVGGGAVLAFVRRQPREKLAFNLPLQLFEVTAAASVFLLMPGHTGHPEAGVAAAVAALTSVAASMTAVTLVVRLATGRWDSAAAREFVRYGAQALLLNVSAGVLAAGALRTSPVAAVPGLIVAGGMFAAYRSHVDLRHRHRNLMLIYDFTTGIDQGATYERRMADLLVRTRDVLRSSHAELLVGDGPRVRRRWADADGALHEEDASGDELFDAVRRKGQPLWGTRGGDLAATRGWRDCLAVPLFADGDVAVLVVAGRTSDVETYTADDALLLGSVAAQLSTALVNGQLLDRLTHDSRHDGLTGLANRTTFSDQLRAAVASGGRVSVLLLDLDRFKEVNDTLGHHVGDLLIGEVATRLRSVTPSSATVARLGGDEFAVLLPGSDAAEARNVAASTWSAIAQPCRVDGVDLDVQCSIGISACPDHGDDPTVLLKRADTAMYAAKRGGSGIEIYDAGRDEHSPRRLVLASQVRTASNVGEMHLEYQPQVDIATGNVVGVEALMRWRHPEYGLVSPIEFIPVAEQSGAIAELSRWALTEATAQAATWRDAGTKLAVSVNLSMRNLTDGAISDHVRALLAEHRLDPALLTLEVTESQVMADPRRTLRVLHGMARLGVGLSIDDFGTGYSSLAYLRQLPVDEIKVDRSFMAGLATGHQEAAIVRAVTDLAQALSMRVVAEGVEDVATLERLRQLGCHRAQGFLFARSMPADEVLPWIAARQPMASRRLAAVPTQRRAETARIG